MTRLRIKYLSSILLFLIFVIRLSADKIELYPTLNQKKYMLYQPIKLTIGIENYSGNTLIFKDQGYLTIHIKTKTGEAIKTRLKGPINLARDLVLSASGRKKLSIDISKLFYLQKQGDYALTVEASHKRLSHTHHYVTEPLHFQIRTPKIILDRRIGFPSTPSETETVIPVRHYTIVRFLQDNDRSIYALQVHDDDYIYAITTLGESLLGVNPSTELDALNNLHILLRINSKHYRYMVFDLNGSLLRESFYIPRLDPLSQQIIIPVLIRDQDIGRVIVSGGQRLTPKMSNLPTQSDLK